MSPTKCFAVVFASLTASHSAGAQCPLLYDFEPGTVVPGEFAWQRSQKTGSTPSILPASACDGSNALSLADGQTPLPYPFDYGETASVEWSFVARVGPSILTSALVGLAFDPTPPIGTRRVLGFGYAVTGETFRTRLDTFPAQEQQSAWLGDTLQAGACYEFRLQMSLTSPGGIATLSYRNLTAGQQTFSVDTTIANRPVRLPADTAYWAFVSGRGTTVDSLRFDNPCRADFNCSYDISVQDIFDFLAAYFSNSGSADFNGVGGITVQDIFEFLATYFHGC